MEVPVELAFRLASRLINQSARKRCHLTWKALSGASTARTPSAAEKFLGANRSLRQAAGLQREWETTKNTNFHSKAHIGCPALFIYQCKRSSHTCNDVPIPRGYGPNGAFDESSSTSTPEDRNGAGGVPGREGGKEAIPPVEGLPAMEERGERTIKYARSVDEVPGAGTGPYTVSMEEDIEDDCDVSGRVQADADDQDVLHTGESQEFKAASTERSDGVVSSEKGIDEYGTTGGSHLAAHTGVQKVLDDIQLSMDDVMDKAGVGPHSGDRGPVYHKDEYGVRPDTSGRGPE